MKIVKGLLLTLSALSWMLSMTVIALNAKYTIAFVTSGSMEPTLYAGDYVLVERTKATECEVGDIIVFNSNTGIKIIHRIVSDGTTLSGYNVLRYFRTKGDANVFEDMEIVTDSNKINKVVMMPNDTLTKIGRTIQNISWWQIVVWTALLMAGPYVVDMKKNKEICRNISVIVEEGAWKC